jgi:ketosteroid isomerase-like protein
VRSTTLELVQAIYSRWERGDFSWIGWAAPQLEYVIADGPTPGSWKGLAGLREGGLGFLSSWDELRVTVEETRELDAERVLVLTRLSGRGKASGLELGEMQARGADILDIRDGKVVRFALYHDRDRAFEELDLASG